MIENLRVRVVQLQSRPRVKSGPQEPRVGDEGTILLVVRDKSGNSVRFIVECNKPDGALAWVADFVAEEIALAP